MDGVIHHRMVIFSQLAKITVEPAQARRYVAGMNMNWSTSHTVPYCFADLIQGIGRALGVQHAWLRAAGPLSSLIWGRLCGMRRRFIDLAARVQAGTLPAKRPPRPPPASPRPATPRPAAVPDQPRLPPQSSGWLLRQVPEPHHVAYWRGPLEQFLADPETIAQVAAAPQTGRILRPLCRMLNVVPPEYLRLPPRPRRKRPPRPKPPLTPEQVDAKVARMSRMAYANMINPNDPDPSGIRPPNRIGYGRPKPLRKPG